MLVALLVGLGFGQVAADAFVFAEEGLAVVFQPVQHLLDVILEQTKRQLLVQLNLLLAPLLLQLSVKTKKKKRKKKQNFKTNQIIARAVNTNFQVTDSEDYSTIS